MTERLPSIENDIEQILCYLYRKPFPEPHHREVPGMILSLLLAWDKASELRPSCDLLDRLKKAHTPT